MGSKWQRLAKETLAKQERIRKTKRSVRGRVWDDWILDLGDPDALPGALAALHFHLGRVVEVHKKHVLVARETEVGHPETEDLWLCTVAKRHFQRSHRERNFVVVGDLVAFGEDGEAPPPVADAMPRGVIQHCLPRTGVVSRQDPLHPEWEHVMVANIDLLVIVASVLHPQVRWGLVDRFLVQAESQGIPPVIVLNKVDLLTTDAAKPRFLADLQERMALYRALGYEIIEVCALRPRKTPSATARLRALAEGKLVGFCGHSGVGKSSIVNLLNPEFPQEVDENPDIFYKGRHTTSFNSLLRLGRHGYGIDTPGVRAFSLSAAWEPEDLSRCFPEFRGLECKYAQCSHEHEPSCGIRAGVEAGTISPLRYQSYLGLLRGVGLREAIPQSAMESRNLAEIAARQQVEEGEDP